MGVFLYRPGHPKANSSGMVEIVYVDPEEAELAVCGPKRASSTLISETHYDGVRSPIDGADISSRKKRKEYMKQNGLADYDDFKGTWEKAGKEREDMRSGHFQEKERTEAVEKAWWQVAEKGYKPKAPRAEVEAQDGVKVEVSTETVIPNHDGPAVELKGND